MPGSFCKFKLHAMMKLFDSGAKTNYDDGTSTGSAGIDASGADYVPLT